MTKVKKATRKNTPPILVYCFPEEKRLIALKADQAGFSTSRYLREVGQAYQITGVVDYERVQELARINGDLGRLGGLLKLWLTDESKVAGVGIDAIRRVLLKIEKSQDEISETMRQVVRPRSAL